MVLLFALLLWLPQNVAHEGAHALAHRLCGDEVTELWPFPGWRSGSFAFAYMRYRTVSGRKTRAQEALCAMAPQLLNTVVLLLTMPVHRLELSGWVLNLVAAWSLVNFVDGAVNLSTFYRWGERPPTDGWRAAAALGAPVFACRAVAVSWQICMALHVFLLLERSL
jgi:hypothetical protein